MRGSSWNRVTLPIRLPAVLALCLSLPGAFCAPQSAAPGGASNETLEAAFRFPEGGRPVSGPVLDRASAPSLVWIVSEDRSLYALSESGRLVTRIALPGSGGEHLGVDPFGRAVICSGSEVALYTRLGSLAWLRDLGAKVDFLPVFGSDGRMFVVAGSRLSCLTPSGVPLWNRSLPASPACPPGVDGRGDVAVALPGGELLLFGPHGEEIGGASAGSDVVSLAPVASGPDLPCLAAGLNDGRLLLLDAQAAVRTRINPGRGGAGGESGVTALQWDGSVLVALERGGRLFGVSSGGAILWTAETGCAAGQLSLFATRIVVATRGRVVSLSPKGEIYREANVLHAAGTGTVGRGGLFFSPGDDWILSAYRFERPLGAPRVDQLAPYSAARGVREENLRFDPAARDSDRQLFLLADIEKRLGSGTIGTDESADAAYCSAVARGELEPDVPDAERPFRSDPLPRARACTVLGTLGSPDYRAALCTVLANDRDPAVRAAACDALGEIGVDPGGLTAAAFLAAAVRPIDEQTAMALVAAVERLALSSGTPPSQEAVRALLTLAQRPYSVPVRDRAIAALGRIAGAVER